MLTIPNICSLNEIYKSLLCSGVVTLMETVLFVTDKLDMGLFTALFKPYAFYMYSEPSL